MTFESNVPKRCVVSGVLVSSVLVLYKVLDRGCSDGARPPAHGAWAIWAISTIGAYTFELYTARQ